MDDFLKMDIFFVATTTIVLLVGVFVMIALVYLIRILRNVDHVVDNVSKESDLLRNDIQTLRGKVRDEGMKWKHVADLLSGIKARRQRGKGKE